MQNLDQNTFNQWMSDFFNRKQNQLQYSNERQAKRTEKLVLDLSVAQTEPLKIAVPFKTIVATKFYLTSSPTTRTDGQVNVLFDQNNLSAIKNSASLGIGDVLECETLINECFLTWDAQADTTVELNLYVDFSVRLGSVNTIISGSLDVSTKPSVPADSFVWNESDGTYTVPVGFIAQIKVQQSGDAKIRIDGLDVMGGIADAAPILGLGSGNLYSTPNGPPSFTVGVPANLVNGALISVPTATGAPAAATFDSTVVAAGTYLGEEVFVMNTQNIGTACTQTFILRAGQTLDLFNGATLGFALGYIEEYTI